MQSWQVTLQKSSDIVNKKLRSFLLSLVFTVLISYILLVNISLKSLLQIFRDFPVGLLLLVMLLHFSAYIFRTVTFYIFFKKEHKISFWYLLNVHFIHNFYVHIIPASLGEFSFPILLKNRIKPEETIPVLFVSRLFFLFVSIVMFIVAVIVNFRLFSNVKIDFKQYLAIGALVIIPVVLIYFFRGRIITVFKNISLFKKFKVRIKETLSNTKFEFLKLKNPRFLITILFFNVINIFVLTLTYKLILHGMNLDLNLLQIIFISSIGIAFILLPIKSIGGFGTTEGAWAIGMLLLGFNKEISISSGFTVHLIALFNVAIFFCIGFLFKKLSDRNYKTEWK